MHIDDITPDDVLEVCRLYQKHLAGHGMQTYLDDRIPEIALGEVEGLLAEIKERWVSYRREGSRFNSSTKLRWELDAERHLSIDVHLNFSPDARSGERYERACQIRDLFLEEVREYLDSRE
mgnify:CR=1 FL=1|jgi:hypothetical protein